MKVAFIVTVLVAAVAAFGTTAAQAQSNVCQTNPDPVDPADPSIIVSAPAANASAPSPLHVEGQARVFEATVSLALYDAGGDEIVSTTTNAAEGQVLSAFSTDVAFSVSADTPACLWVFEASAQDGSPTNVVQVPLTLRATGLPPAGSGAAPEQHSFGWTLAALALAGAGLVGAGAYALRRAR
jgi:hypothetical protein